MTRYCLSFFIIAMCFMDMAHAARVQSRDVLSPIVGKTFKVNLIPFDSERSEALAQMPADMGVDSDGCRHHSGISPYDYYIVTCPYTYFSANAAEWSERTGRFTQPLSNEFKTWVRGGKGLHSPWFMARNQKFKTAQLIARSRGEEIGTIDKFVIPQEHIGVDNKYNYALRCYAQRGARDSFMAKTALTAAWAMRVHLNRQLSDKDLAGGVQEINDRIGRHIKEGEDFDAVKWHAVYKKIFNGTRLSNEAYFIAGSSYLGLELRLGGHAECDVILDKLTKRFKDVKHGEKLRGIVRERRRILDQYRRFLRTAVVSFARAMSKESVRRSELPTVMLAVAEGLRRTGSIEEAIDWYLAIDNMDETEPELRASIREAQRAPSPHASFYVHIGWKAHLMIEKLTAGRVRELVIGGREAFLLNAIVNEGLGTPEHNNPHWNPAVGASLKDLEFMMNHLGTSLIDYQFRLGKWPLTLGELWTTGVIPDWNTFNRFHCPVTGAAFVYDVKAMLKTTSQKVVLLRTSTPVPTNQGPRYLNFIANRSLVWTEVAVPIGHPVP